MNGTRRWVLAIVVVLLLIGLVGIARGQAHRHGQQVGALTNHSSIQLGANL